MGIFYRLPMDGRDFLKMPEVIQINDMECVARVLPGAVIPAGAVEISEEEFESYRPAMPDPPEPEPPQPTNTEIKELLLDTMEGMADMYAALITLQGGGE